MFRQVALRGKRGEINSGFRLAASLSSWVVSRNEQRQWSLSAVIDRIDTFQIARRPLQFTAPRYEKPLGHWAFEVRTLDVRGTQLTATLSPPLFGR